MNDIRLVLADDHPLYRDGVARTFAEAGGISVIGQAQDGFEAFALCRDLQPDLVLLDISMPHGGGLGALLKIMALPTPPLVAMLTASEDADVLMQALRAGAVGYILKGVGARELVQHVRDFAAGKSYVAPELAGRSHGLLPRSGDFASRNPLAALSLREVQILKLVSHGLSNKEAGLELNLQEKTVKHYMTSILQKLNVRNRVEAAMIARQHHKD